MEQTSKSSTEPQSNLEEDPCPLDEPGNCLLSEEKSIEMDETPASIINNLAIRNRIFHQFYVIKAEGPCHAKKFTVSLSLGDEKYTGEGLSIQKAKHAAAANALKETSYKHLAAAKKKKDKTDAPSLKSQISLVYEIASQQNLPVDFEILSETGPPHMKVFITECKVGNLVSAGEGFSKKESKNKAAETMLEHLKIVTLDLRFQRKLALMKKYFKQIFEQENPISILNRIQQKKRESPPFYTFVGEKNGEFVIEVLAGEKRATGSGKRKNSAKKNAAHNLLKVMGYTFEEETVKAE